jgi:hypothetical protein
MIWKTILKTTTGHLLVKAVDFCESNQEMDG